MELVSASKTGRASSRMKGSRVKEGKKGLGSHIEREQVYMVSERGGQGRDYGTRCAGKFVTNGGSRFRRPKFRYSWPLPPGHSNAPGKTMRREWQRRLTACTKNPMFEVSAQPETNMVDFVENGGAEFLSRRMP